MTGRVPSPKPLIVEEGQLTNLTQDLLTLVS